MKILSFQPFSVYEAGGGSRILRRLYEGHEFQIISLVVQSGKCSPPVGKIREITIPAFPQHKRWMRWRLRNFSIWLREKLFYPITIKRICSKATNIAFDVVHVINHGPFSAALCKESFVSTKIFWVSFHDHFSTTFSTFEDAKKLWLCANRRLVISEELGKEYQKLFGNKEFEIITDGVANSEISKPMEKYECPVIFYFAGLLHIEYLPLFRSFADMLDLITKEGFSVKLILRGTQNIKFLNGRSFEIEYRPLTLNNIELKTEMDTASFLYLPIKFTVPDFYMYSLSTKMVGYLGATGSILYHGPKNSAVGNLLEKSQSGICCYSLASSELIACLKYSMNNINQYSSNAKILALNQFNLKKIQSFFWEEK